MSRRFAITGSSGFIARHRLMSSIRRRRYIRVGAGSNRKSIVYVGNIVSGFFFLLERQGPGIHVHNLVDEPAITSRAIAEHLAKSLGVSLPEFRIPVCATIPMAAPLDWIAHVSGKVSRSKHARGQQAGSSALKGNQDNAW